MKKLTFLLFLFVCGSIAAQLIPTRRRLFVIPVSSGGSCPEDGSPSESNDGVTLSAVWGATGRNWYGQSRYIPSADRTICKLGFKISAGASLSSTNKFTASIWTHTTSPNYNLSVKLAESSDIAGDNTWTNQWLYFSFPTPFVITNGVPYALVFGPTNYLTSNDLYGYNDNTAMSGYKDTFSTAGAASDAGGNDCAIKIYWQ